MSTFVGTSLFFRSTLCVAMETMQFRIAQMGLFFRAIFSHLGGLPNNLTLIRSFPDGARLVLFDPRAPKNVHDVTFYRYKITIYFGIPYIWA